MVSEQQIAQLLHNPQVQQLVQALLSKVAPGRSLDVNQLIDALTDGGLGGEVQSWVGVGDNEPITGEQLQQALGEPTIGTVAQETGLSSPQAADQLANVLPSLVDSLTPGGQLPDPQVMRHQLAQLLSGDPA